MSGRRYLSNSSNVFCMIRGCTLQHLLVRPLAIGGEHGPVGLLAPGLAIFAVLIGRAQTMVIDLCTSRFETVETHCPWPCQIGQGCSVQAIPVAGERIWRWDDGSIRPDSVRNSEAVVVEPCYGFGILQKLLADVEGMTYFADKRVVGVCRIFPRQMDPKSSIGGIRTAAVRRSSVQLGARYIPNLR